MTDPKGGRNRPVDVTLQEDPEVVSALIQQARERQRPVLVVMAGNEVGRRFPLDRSMVVGRALGVDVLLTDARVSGRHALVEDRGDSWTVVDLGSRNGTRVNGERVAERALRPGDRVMLGNTVLEFELLDPVAQEYNELVERLVNVDDLTGLYARRKFDAELARLIDAARQRGDRVGLLAMDLDGIKQINDTHGHLFGAYSIGESGKLIGRVVEGRGFATRFGGDEFIAALPGLDAAGAAAVAEEIRQAIAAHRFEREGIQLQPRISIGVAAHPEDADGAEALFQRADEALYRAKRGGKNRVCR